MKNLSLLLYFISMLLPLFSKANEISFAENKGQWNEAVHFRADIPKGAMFITQQGPVYNFINQQDLFDQHKDEVNQGKDPFEGRYHGHAYQMYFVNANPEASFQTFGQSDYYENFFIGNDKNKWASEVHHFDRIKQNDVFKNIDLVYYAKNGSVKYDFILKSGAKMQDIKMQLKGANVALNAKGQLIISTTVNQVIEDAPIAYQIIAGDTFFIKCQYVLNENRIGFKAEKYNAKYALIIDPSLIFATYSGATLNNFFSYTSTYDYSEHTIIGALAFGIGWPYNLGAYDTTFNGNVDIAIMKLTGNGSTRVFATYLGGSDGELPHSLTTDLNDNIYLIGYTNSNNFPITASNLQSTNAGNGDLYISKINSTGTALIASTYLGGSNTEGNQNLMFSPFDITRTNLSPTNIKYNKYDNSLWFVTNSYSSNFPTTSNAMQASFSNNGALIAQVNTNLNQLLYSSFLNANDSTFTQDLKISNTNSIYLSGTSKATNLGTTGAFHPNYLGGQSDGFVLKFNPITKSIISGTYLGTTNIDNALKMTVSPNEQWVYVSGQSLGSYPVSPNNFGSGTLSRNYIQKLDSTLTNNLGSSSFGGLEPFYTSDVFMGRCAALGIAGMQNGSGFPTTSDAYSTTPSNFWFGVFNLSLDNILYGTYYGDQNGHTHHGTFNFDTLGNIHHSVCDETGSFPTTPNAWSPIKLTPHFDMISFKFEVNTNVRTLHFELDSNYNDTGCVPHHIALLNSSVNYNEYHWDFGNGITSDSVSPSFTYTSPGHYKVLLIGKNTLCNYIDRDSLYIVVKDNRSITPYATLDTTVCRNGNPFLIKIDSVSPASNLYLYQVIWEPANALTNNSGPLQAIVYPDRTNYVQVIFQGLPNDSFCMTDTSILININNFDSAQVYIDPVEKSICWGDSVLIKAFGGIAYEWSPNVNLNFVNTNEAYSNSLSSILYTIKIVDPHQCKYTRTSDITVWPKSEVNAGPDAIVKPGDMAQFYGSVNTNSFQWLTNNTPVFPNELNPSFYPADSQMYVLAAIDEHGCTFYDTVWVFVNDIVRVNAFTPNGDGKNDVFYPIPLNDHAKMLNFSVYNRYGERIFYTKKLKGAWDGYFNNRPCDAGTYFYLVEYEIGEKRYREKGDVTLIK